MFQVSRRRSVPFCHQTKPIKRRTILKLETLEDRTVPTLLGTQLYPSDNPWNQRIASAPAATNSAAILNNIITRYGDGRLHPDFGQDYHDSSDLYGIPYNIVHGNSTAKTSVVIDAYPDESDLLSVPLPANVVLEGDFQNGPRVGVDNRGDSHLLIYDVDNKIAYEFYRASRPSENSDGRWHADQETVWDMKTNNFRILGYTSADAAGLSLLAGLVRPDEGLPVSQGGQGVINHAIRFTLQNSIILDQFTYPASHTANPGNTNRSIMPPMGARFRLKSSVDISTLNPQSQIIAQAMKDYGMIVADNGSNFFFSGASYAVDTSNNNVLTWNDNDIQDSTHGLKSLKFSMFEVVDLTPAISGLSTHNAPAGTAVTVSGQNFTGSAGHIQVLFGNVPATGVVVVNDSTITCNAPAGGSGTVDVRVVSGVTTGANSENYTSPVFGYGTSAVNAADQFTYGSGGGGTNQPPTVSKPATASATTVTGRTVNLSALGVDDGGASNLTYTWNYSGPGTVSFSSNGTNAAQNTTATFTKAGSYSFTVTIADSQGLTVTSSVNVTVNQTVTSITVSPGTASVRRSGSLAFAATAFDQFGASLATKPTFTWSLSGQGTINKNGLYTAPRRTGGPYTVIASVGSVRGTAKVTVIR